MPRESSKQIYNLLEQQDSLSSWIEVSNEYALHEVSGSSLYHMHLETSPNPTHRYQLSGSNP